MGSVIPSTDQRLGKRILTAWLRSRILTGSTGAIERQKDLNVNTASDFIAQYTTRQEYRFIDGLNDQDEEWLRFGNNGLSIYLSFVFADTKIL